MDFKKYIEEVKSQLQCNASEDYINNHVTYMYTDAEIDANLDYFKRCMESGLSPYKSLLFFNDYLNR